MISKDGILEWRSPEPRAIVPLDDRFTIGKRLSKKLDSGIFQATFNRSFRDVVHACAEPRPGSPRVWITPEVCHAYVRLHELGHAHSVEIWRGNQLVGGEYGVAIGGFYSGESMFTREDYAGRVAMVHLVRRLRERGFTLLDSQYMNPTAREFGAVEVDRHEYARLLAGALSCEASFL